MYSGWSVGDPGYVDVCTVDAVLEIQNACIVGGVLEIQDACTVGGVLEIQDT